MAKGSGATYSRKSTYILFVADLHAGHKVGLLNPETELVDDNTGDMYHPGPSATQRHLHDLQLRHIAQVAEIVGRRPVTLCVVGDLCHGNRHVAHLSVPTIKGQVTCAAWNLRPYLDSLRVTKVRILVGTAAHTFGDGSAEVLVGNQLRLWYPRADVEVAYHYRFEVGGEIVNVAHHGPGKGIRWWLQGNNARHYLRSLMMDEADRYGTPSRLVVRAHYHRYFEAPDSLRIKGQWRRALLIGLPCYAGIDDYVRKATRSTPTLDWGCVLAEFVPEFLRVIPLYETFDLTKYEAL